MSRTRVCWQLLRTGSVETNDTWLINARSVHWFKFITQAHSCIYIQMYLLFWNYFLWIGSLPTGACSIPVCAHLYHIPKKKESYTSGSSPGWFPHWRKMVSSGKLIVHMLLKQNQISLGYRLNTYRHFFFLKKSTGANVAKRSKGVGEGPGLKFTVGSPK